MGCDMQEVQLLWVCLGGVIGWILGLVILYIFFKLIGKIITRSECLDLSGTTENVDYCVKCEIGQATKEKLLPR